MANELFRTSVMLPNGKRKWIRSKSKEGLEQKKKEVMLQIGTGLDILDNSTFGEYAEVWFNVYKKPYLRRKSLEALRNALNNHIYPFLRDVFNAAVDNNLIAKSPVPTKIKSKGVRTKEKTALTADQSKRLLDAVSSTRAYLFCLIALQTGMRRGEICGLMWEDIDLDKQIIHVRHNAVFTSSQTIVSEALKTSAAVRDIPIPPTLLDTLKGLKSSGGSPFILHMENGKPLSQSSFSNLWDMVRRRTVDDPAELGTKATNSKMVRSLDFHVTPHLLRHTYITRLFESGMDIKEIQYLAGHTTVDMTLRVYTHYQHETRQQDTANKVCAALG